MNKTQSGLLLDLTALFTEVVYQSLAFNTSKIEEEDNIYDNTVFRHTQDFLLDVTRLILQFSDNYIVNDTKTQTRDKQSVVLKYSEPVRVRDDHGNCNFFPPSFSLELILRNMHLNDVIDSDDVVSVAENNNADWFSSSSSGGSDKDSCVYFVVDLL